MTCNEHPLLRITLKRGN